MPGFTIKLDTSELTRGAQKAQQSAAAISNEMKIVANDVKKVQETLHGMSEASINAAKKAGMFLDSWGRWHNSAGGFATQAEKLAVGVRNVGKEAMQSSGKLRQVSQETESAAIASGKFDNSISTLSSKIGDYAKRIAVLYGAYRTLETVLGTVRRGLDFSSSLEASEISIASVIAATNKLSDAQGNVLEGADKFNAAQELSKSMMDEIQVLALQTTATFDSLADGVAGVIAPATKFGVSMEKLPAFAVRAAQAMTTMKVPVQQMRTEIEALLSGNINRAQDILATNLGITGEMVRNWQQQGTLVDELNKRLEAFAIAGDRVADSWSGLRGNMEDALNYLSGRTGRGIFEGAKQAYRELLDLMVSTEGKVGVGKDIENLVELLTDVQNIIGQELVDATRGFIELVKELNEPESVDKIRRTFIATADTVVGVAQGLSDMKDGVSALADMLGADPAVTAAGGLVGYKLFGPKGLLLGIISEVVLKSLEQLGKFFAFMQNKAGFGNIDISDMPEDATAEELAEWWKDKFGPDSEAITEAVKSAEEAGRKTVEAYKKAVNNSFDVLGGLSQPISNKKDVDVTPMIKGGKSAKDLEKEREAADRAAKKAEREEQKRLREKADLLKELGELTDDDNLTLQAQTMLIEQQADAFRKALPEMTGFIDQWEQLKKADLDPNLFIQPSQQLKRFEDSMEDFYKSSMDWGSQLADTMQNAFGGMEEALVQFATTGKLSFSDMINSMISDLMRLMIRQSITGPLAKALGGGIAGLFNSNPYGGAYSSGVVQTVPRGALYGPSALGNVFTGPGSLHSYSNSIVTRPTIFTAGERLPHYANGAGLMGEAGPEAIMPLKRMSNGKLGVEARGAGSEPVVNVNIVNSTGQQATTRTRSDNHGNKTIDVCVGDMAAKQMATPGTTLNRAVSAQTGTRRPAIKR